MALHLSKSKFCSAVQCPKILWLKANMPDEFDDSVMNETVLKRGLEVGDLAMGLFGPFVEVPYGNLGDMLSKTKELLDEDTHIIAEASFSKNNCFCSVDILINNGNNKVELYEVKSSTEVKDIYLYDVAYQYYVLTEMGFEVEKAGLVYIDNTYVRHGDVDMQELFAIADVTTEVKNLQPEVRSYIEELRRYMDQTDEPSQAIGLHCFKPYECGFWKYCTRNLPQPNVFDVASLRKNQKIGLLNQGIISFEDIEENDAVAEKYMIQVQHELHDMPEDINETEIRMFMKDLYYPMYFLDFETFQPAVPMYDESRPYEQITFQYSLHYVLEEGGEVMHKEFLAYPGEDPRRAVAEHLCEDIPKDVCVIAYNMGFEKGRIATMAELYPSMREHLMNIHDHIQDLMIPFQKKHYYNKAMQGSYSIKYVLPALFPGDPELDYHNLEEVHNGGEASATFMAMHNMTLEELKSSRKNLLKYCELDTYAMVKIWQKLKQI